MIANLLKNEQFAKRIYIFFDKLMHAYPLPD